MDGTIQYGLYLPVSGPLFGRCWFWRCEDAWVWAENHEIDCDACPSDHWWHPSLCVLINRDVAIHSQYGQEVTFKTELKRLANVGPSLLLLIHFTLHHSSHLFTRLTLFSLSAIGGSYMVYAMNKYSYLLVMKRTPALGTLWVYSVIRMELADAVISLCMVAVWCWFMRLSLMVWFEAFHCASRNPKMLLRRVPTRLTFG